MAGMCTAFFQGDLARRPEAALQDVAPDGGHVLSRPTPCPVKTALKLMGKITGEVRQPLCPMSDANENKLRQVMQKYGLIK